MPLISPLIFLNNIIDLSPKNSNLVSCKNISLNILELKFFPDNYVGLLELIKKMPAQATKSSKYLIGSSILEGVSYL